MARRAPSKGQMHGVSACDGLLPAAAGSQACVVAAVALLSGVISSGHASGSTRNGVAGGPARQAQGGSAQ